MVRLRAHAENNPISPEAIALAMSDGVPFTDENSHVVLPTGFQVTYTIMQHHVGTMRHVSISSPNTDKVPLPQAIDMILPHLGYRQTFEEIEIKWLEDVSDGRKAVNLLEPMTIN